MNTQMTQVIQEFIDQLVLIDERAESKALLSYPLQKPNFALRRLLGPFLGCCTTPGTDAEIFFQQLGM